MTFTKQYSRIMDGAGSPIKNGHGLRLRAGVLLASWFVCAAASAGVLDGVHPRVHLTAHIDDTQRVALVGNTHPALKSSTDLGAADDSTPLTSMVLVLNSDADQSAALEAYLKELRDPASPNYQQWLTPAAFAQHFGVSTNDLETVTNWLKSHGFNIDATPTGNRFIVFSGTVAQVREAFHTQLHHYAYKGVTHIANATDPQIPAALAEVVAGVMSLHDFKPAPQNIAANPTVNYTDGSGAHLLVPADFATIYDLNSLYANSINGAGQTIAVLGQSDVLATDIAQFRALTGLPVNPLHTTTILPDPGTVSSDELESDLDLEWAGAVAPSALINFVTSTNVGISALNAVSNNIGNIISLSYGTCEASMGSASVTAWGNLWQQATLQGISVFVASGDSGAAGCDADTESIAVRGLGVNGLCSSPYSTCVGGSQFNDTANPSLYWNSTNNAVNQSSARSYIPEVVWNLSVSSGHLASSGGGMSTTWPKPSWQLGLDIPADKNRDVPDVALNAGFNDGYRVYKDGAWLSTTVSGTVYQLAYGGTSVSTPAFAGIAALLNQKYGAQGGAVNANLYRLSSLQAAGVGNGYFHLITSGTNGVPGQSGYSASTAQPYYNQATGLGSVDAANLVNHWSDPCTASLGSTSQSVPASAYSSSVSVTSPAACTWSSSSNASWLTVSSGASGVGNGSVGYAVSANNSPSSRSGILTVAGKSYTLTQAGVVVPSTPVINTPTKPNLGSNDAIVVISWTASTDVLGVIGYSLSIDGASPIKLGVVTSYTDSTLSYGAHVFSLTAVDSAGTSSAVASYSYSNTDTVPPTAPGAMSVTHINFAQFQAKWGAASDNVGVANYKVVVDGLAPMVVSGTQTNVVFGLTPSTALSTHTFTVQAFDAAGNPSPVTTLTYTVPKKPSLGVLAADAMRLILMH